MFRQLGAGSFLEACICSRFQNLGLALSEEHVPDGRVHVVVDGLSGVDHEPVHELHRLGALAAQLPRHHHLAALGAALHDEAQHAVARPAEKHAHVRSACRCAHCRQWLGQFQL